MNYSGFDPEQRAFKLFCKCAFLQKLPAKIQ